MKKLAATVIALGLTTVAFAQPESPATPSQQPRQAAPEQPRDAAPTMTFEAVDKNKDGRVNRDEASTVKGLDFVAADANKDSALDRQEYTAAIAKIQAPRG
jgi:hypothetical protein